MEISAVIVGGLHHNTLGVIRSLGEEGIPKSNIRVLIVEEKYSNSNFLSKSKYLNKENIFNVSSYGEVSPWLEKNADIHKKSVVICCSDGSAEAVMASYDLLKDFYFTPSVKVNIHEFMSKEKQNELAIEAGFNIPASKVICTNDIIDWDVFPCIIKPLTSVSGVKGDIRILYNRTELESALKETVAQNIQIQEYIDKKMEYQLIGCSLDDGNKVILPGYTDIIRQPEYTNTGYLRYSPIKGISFNSEAVSSFLKSLGYNGLFSIEFIRGKDENDYFLEINMRNDGNAYCVKSAGVNLPFVWCYYQMFDSLPDIKLEFDTPVLFIPDWLDARRGIQSAGIWGWIKQFYNAESHAVFNRRDMGPFLFQTKEMVVFAGKCLSKKMIGMLGRKEKQ